MTRTHRLIQMMQTLRRLPQPMTATVLADEMQISTRTVYRDIDALRSMGAVIDGEAGYGYTLVEDATLPPLGFEDDELEALVLGLNDVAVIGDPALAEAAKSALSKIKARVPPRQAHRLQHAVLDVRRYYQAPKIVIDVGVLRAAAWDEVSVRFSYCDGQGQSTLREVDPLALVYMDRSNMLLSWCHLRKDFRHFRLDRMRDLVRTDHSFRPNRIALLRQHIEYLRCEFGEQAKDCKVKGRDLSPNPECG